DCATLGGFAHVAHAEPHAALAVDLEHLHAHEIALLELVAHALDAIVRYLRDVHETVATRPDRDERAEVHEPRDLALVNSPDLDVRGDQLDPLLRCAPGLAVDRRDLDGAVVLDVDRGARFLGDPANHRAALADDLANLLRVDLHGDDRRRPFRHLLARAANHLVHLAEDVEPALAGLRERLGHDLAGDAEDFDVHLQRRDAVHRARDLEVHVAKVILVAEDVREHLEAVVFLDQAHRDTGDGPLDRHTRIHQREACAADARHRARAIRLGDLGNDADHVRIGLHVWHHGGDAAPRQSAVADLTTFRRAHKACLTNAIRREVIVKHEGIAPLAVERIDDLRVTARAERRHHERLRFTTREHGRAVRPRQNADLDAYRQTDAWVAAVDTRLARDDTAANDLALYVMELALDLTGAPAARLGRDLGDALLLDLADLRVTGLLL